MRRTSRVAGFPSQSCLVCGVWRVSHRGYGLAFRGCHDRHSKRKQFL
jgi:hypothetical protein